MVILGIDPGTAITGFGVIESANSGQQFVAAGVLRTKSSQPLGLRLAEIYQEVNQLISEYHPTQMAVESLFFAKNVTTAMSVRQARGVIVLAGTQANLKVAEYTPLQVKQALTNYGRADKKQVQLMVKQVLKLSDIPKTDDAADGLAIALCHAANLRVQ